MCHVGAWRCPGQGPKAVCEKQQSHLVWWENLEDPFHGKRASQMISVEVFVAILAFVAACLISRLGCLISLRLLGVCSPFLDIRAYCSR